VSAASVRTIRHDESGALRALRLRALADAPAAFASTLTAESALDDDHWRRLVEDQQGTIAVAVDGDRWVGMAAGRWYERDRGIAQLWGLWVDPAARGTGTGSALVGAVRDWAAAQGATFVRLGIIEPADQLRRFYERRGFVALDDPAPLRTDPPNAVVNLPVRSTVRLAVFMVRPI
jgi:GNAT superfamily N-acetyltransferase